MARNKKSDSPKLMLSLVNVHSQPLSEPADIMLRHQETGAPLVVRGATGSPIVVEGCKAGVYLVQVDPASYLATGAFVMTGNRQPVVMTFPVDPRKVVRVIFPSYSALCDDAKRMLKTTAVLGFADKSGEDLYDALDDIRKAGFHNIVAKSTATALTNQRTVASYFETLKELRGDRFFVVVSQELREETKNSARAGLFTEEPECLHHPPAGFDHAGSFKTPDRYGNLQLTFFTDGTNWVADVDIDDANGLAHIFQVLRNQMTGRPTHPYDIHEILIAHQKLSPGYDLRVG